MAPFGADKGDAKLLRDAIPRGGVRLQYHPDLPQWSNWIHALQQKPCKTPPPHQLSLRAALPGRLTGDNFLIDSALQSSKLSFYFCFLLENKFQGTSKGVLKRRNWSYEP